MKFIFFTSHLKFCSSIYLRSDVPVFVSVSSKTAPSTMMCVTSVWTNGWRGDILVEKIQDMMGAASASIYPINLL